MPFHHHHAHERTARAAATHWLARWQTDNHADDGCHHYILSCARRFSLTIRIPDRATDTVREGRKWAIGCLNECPTDRLVRESGKLLIG